MEEALEQIQQAIMFLSEKLDAANERYDKLEKVVMEELIGGITKLYDTNKRAESVRGFRGKHEGLFGPVMDGWKELYPDNDLFETIFDAIEKFKGSDPEWNDDKELDSVKRLSGTLLDKFKKVAPKEAVAVEVEVSPEEEFGKMIDRRKKARSDIGS